jgi:uncharacterized YccA/Bax inhibitor family protein
MALSLKSNNPILRSNPFAAAPALTLEGTMTVDGTVNKTGALMICVAVPAVWTWNLVRGGDLPLATLLLVAGVIGGFITALVTIWKKQWSAVTAPLYALLEGLVLGGISAISEASYPGIAINAVILTIGTLVALLVGYRAGVLRATEGFKRGVFAATAGIALLYLVTIVLGFFHIQIPQIYAAGPIGIGFSLVVVVIAALNLVLDFDLIETGARQGAPKYMEWYGAFALMVTLIWLYMEILRLLSKLRSRR